MRILPVTLMALVAIVGCQPAPSPTPTTAPKPTEAAKPAASPAASPAAAKPAASPAASPAAVPAPATKPSAAAPTRSFNEQAVADFYRGKTVTLIVSSTAGGGYDLYGRMLARHIGRHIPGNPNVIVQNMPGAGGIVAANSLFSGPQDGTQFGTFTRGLPSEELFGTEGVRFKSNDFHWMGSMNEEVSVCAARTDSPIKRLEDLFTTESTVGGTGAGADTDFFPLLMNALFGTKYKVISGYPGGNEVNLAVERGELHGRCGWSYSSVKSTRAEWFKDRPFMKILVQMSLKKHPEIPEVPLVMELAKTEEQVQLARVVFSRQTMGRPFAIPPQVPADRVAALRTAFDKTMVDPDFLGETDKASVEINNPTTGEEVQALVAEILKTSPDLARKLASIIEDASR